jgi:hypothetical protein
MRVMEIPRFPREVQPPRLADFIPKRLSQEIILWPEQAKALAAYACWPDDEATRVRMRHVLLGPGPDFPKRARKFLRMQHEWARVADIFHLWYGLKMGAHQDRRGGPSLSKAVTLAANHSQSRGTGEANLWRLWDKYKDVAHLVTAACSACRDVRRKSCGKPFGSYGLPSSQFLPLQMIMFMPDLVLAVALEFERHGLEGAPHSRSEPPLDAHSIWRIPHDINVVTVLPPKRPITKGYLVTLNERRAGNRGRRSTTPIFEVSSEPSLSR